MAYSNTKAFKRDLSVGLPKLNPINRGVLIKIQSGVVIYWGSPQSKSHVGGAVSPVILLFVLLLFTWLCGI